MPTASLSSPRFAGPYGVLRLSDAALAARLAAGDRTALEVIYVRHAPALRRYARRFVGPALAEDAVHEALASTQVALLGAHRVVELRAWLFRCVRNACLSELDRAANRTAELADEPAAAGGADACDVACCNERLHAALDGMAALPPRQREALALRALEGAGYDELAERFALTENAAMQLVHRARRNLSAKVAA